MHASKRLRLVTLGVGAQASPAYAPAGLLISVAGTRVMLDGGPGAEPDGDVDAWLVCDEKSELRAALRRLALGHAVTPRVAPFQAGPLKLTPRAVVHTNHPTYGYEITYGAARAVWAPKFLRFPR